MKIAVVGGSGFIGTHLTCQLIANGQQVAIFDKEISSAFPDICTIVDVRDSKGLNSALVSFDVIINLAAEHRDDVRPESLYFDVNVEGARNVCLAARLNGIKQIIFTSTVALYGLNAGCPNEESPAKPFNVYGRSKYEAEKVYKDWLTEDKTRVLTILRPVVVFGENNRGNVYNLLTRIRDRKFMMVGNGNNRKSMAYVGNIVDFIEMMIGKEPGLHLYNYVDGPDLMTKDLLTIARRSFGIKGMPISVPYYIGLIGGIFFDVVSGVTGRSFPISSVRIKKFCADTTVSGQKIRDLGFCARYSLKEGLQRMIAHDFCG